MSNLTDFFPSGGGGLTPKFQEFNASGTFTPSQALIDAGGYIELFLVAGGSGGCTNSPSNGGTGGEAQIKSMYLTTTTGCTITIGSGGTKGTAPAAGGNSVFEGALAGGITITSLGGQWWNGNTSTYIPSMINSSYGAVSGGDWYNAGSGVLGYGEGGGTMYGGGPRANPLKANSGKGGSSGSSDVRTTDGASGYCLIKWYE
jgi:hypothetical protein